jgi:hypothetical protein
VITLPTHLAGKARKIAIFGNKTIEIVNEPASVSCDFPVFFYKCAL